MHEENSNEERKDVRKSDGEEFGEVRLGRKRSKPTIDKPSMNGIL